MSASPNWWNPSNIWSLMNHFVTMSIFWFWWCAAWISRPLGGCWEMGMWAFSGTVFATSCESRIPSKLKSTTTTAEMSYTKKADCGQFQIHRLSRKAYIGRWGLLLSPSNQQFIPQKSSLFAIRQPLPSHLEHVPHKNISVTLWSLLDNQKSNPPPSTHTHISTFVHPPSKSCVFPSRGLTKLHAVPLLLSGSVAETGNPIPGQGNHLSDWVWTWVTVPRSPVTPSAPSHCPHMPCGRLVLAWLLTA